VILYAFARDGRRLVLPGLNLMISMLAAGGNHRHAAIEMAAAADHRTIPTSG
jgi:hypothetical protein